MMIWTIIAPELVLAWAVRQWSAAKKVQKKYQNVSQGISPRSFCAFYDFSTTDLIDNKWTMNHGHFLIMGGFTLIGKNKVTSKDEPLGPVWEEKFERLLGHSPSDSQIDFPTVTLAEIKDKSKGDELSKTLAILQTTWFLLQCAARIPQKLALTELELATLALASLNAVTYAFWWYKPLQVQEPVKIYLKQPIEKVDEQKSVAKGPIREVWDKILVMIQEFRDLLRRFGQNPCRYNPFVTIAFVLIAIPFFIVGLLLTFFPIAIVTILNLLKTDDSPLLLEHHSPGRRSRIATRIVLRLRQFRNWLTTPIFKFFQDKFFQVWSGNSHWFLLGLFIIFPLLFLASIILVILLLPLLTLVTLVSFLFNSIFAIIATDTIPDGAQDVPPFYAPRTESDRYSRMLIFASFGLLLGALHGIAWFFAYPSHVERTLWRIGSIAITGIPVIVAPIDFLLEWEESQQPTGVFWLPGIVISALDFVMTMLLFVYVPSRLLLIGQSVALLRPGAQPPSAFLSVDWAKFVPHVFSS